MTQTKQPLTVAQRSGIAKIDAHMKAHSPPTKMGVAWEYLADQISRGAITVIEGSS